MKTILFTCAGRRAYLLKFFKESLGDKIKIVATDMSSTAPALAFADVAEIVPSVHDASYLNIITELCTKYKVDAIIPLNDLELPILAQNHNHFKTNNVKLILPNKEIIDTCFDKLKTAHFIESIGLNTPKTYVDLNIVYQDIRKGVLNFPLIIKPRWGSGSIGIEIVYNIDQIEKTYNYVKLKVRNSILDQISVCDDCVLIQEAIQGIEYGVDIFNDFNSNYVTTIVKQKLSMRAGETDKAITIDDAEIRLIGEVISRHTKHIGNLDCDLFKANNRYYVLEMNPRFGGGYPFSHYAGANAPLAFYHWLSGDSAPSDCFDVIYGKCFAKYDLLTEVKQ